MRQRIKTVHRFAMQLQKSVKMFNINNKEH